LPLIAPRYPAPPTTMIAVIAAAMLEMRDCFGGRIVDRKIPAA
jgi:hypothetical protein